MGTLYKRSAEAVMQLHAALGGLQQCPSGATVTAWKVSQAAHSKPRCCTCHSDALCLGHGYGVA